MFLGLRRLTLDFCGVWSSIAKYVGESSAVVLRESSGLIYGRYPFRISAEVLLVLTNVSCESPRILQAGIAVQGPVEQDCFLLKK